MRAGVASAMTAYNTPDDVPIVIGQKWTRKWLRGEAGFKGCVITDWTEIYNQLDWHHSASTPVEAISQALSRTAIDMVCLHSPTLPAVQHCWSVHSQCCMRCPSCIVAVWWG